MDTDSSIVSMAKFMNEIENLRDLKDAVQEYVDSISDYDSHSLYHCACVFCEMVKALRDCNDDN